MNRFSRAPNLEWLTKLIKTIQSVETQAHARVTMDWIFRLPNDVFYPFRRSDFVEFAEGVFATREERKKDGETDGSICGESAGNGRGGWFDLA